MPVLQPAAVVQSKTTEDQSDVIEVVGTRADQAFRIDRRTYQVKQTPHSSQKDTIQLLRGLPAITITPNDEINLLGASNVKVLIDGHESRTDLHTLHGSDIDRIEIITNPSAQYSAEGTGGIINIILRKKQGEGMSGNTSVEVSSFARLNSIATLKYKKGKWTYEIAPELTTGEWRHSSYHKLRSIEKVAGGRSTINSEAGGGPQQINDALLRMKATYELDSRTSISAEGFGGGSRFSSFNDANFGAVTADFVSFSQRQTQIAAANFLAGVLTFDHKGSREGETLQASANLFGNPYTRESTTARLSSGASLFSERRTGSLYSDDKIDWEHPVGRKQILSMGAEWFLQQARHRYRFTSSDMASSATDTFDDYRGFESTVSAYSTLQQPIGTWTVMPGIRFERNSRRVFSPGLRQVRVHRTDLFPTLHIEYPLGKSFVLTLSYSKRIDRPQIEQLRPYPVETDVQTIIQGNPRLRDQSTDSYELNVHYHRKNVDAGVIVYDRETDRLVSESFFVNASGQNVVTWVNTGRRRDRGAEVDLNTPVASRVKLMTSINLFDSRVPIDAVNSDVTDERFRFTSNSTLEWDGPDRHGKPGDIAQLLWHYEGPSTEFQFRNFGWHDVTLSYTHSFSRTVSATATAETGVLHNGHRLIAPLVQEYYAVHNRPQFKFKLMKTFGNP